MNISINELVEALRENRLIGPVDLLEDVAGELVEPSPPVPSPYVQGSSWLFRSVTNYTVGTVDYVSGTSIVLREGAAWVADTGRFNEFLRDGWSKASEVEPSPDGCLTVVEQGAIVTAHLWAHGDMRKVIG